MGGEDSKERIYICIDLKSFYASVECRERKLDPMRTNLVVADPERTEKTICLAVSPAMKALGVPGRCRVFEIPPDIPYIMAQPRMQLYIDYSAKIYSIYLKYIAREDIHVYSIDEVFMDATDYLPLYGVSARELGIRIMEDILEHVGIHAACGIGTNLYLAKIALDITAKHRADRIGELDEETYCRSLWRHRPLTDFWRVGLGTARRLEYLGIYTMEDIARAEEKVLYGLLGVDAELLIDHAWGREPVTMKDIKNYRPKSNSITSGQVLPRDYSFEEGKLVIKEMADMMCLELVEKELVTASITLHVGYENRLRMKSAHGTKSLRAATNSAKVIISGVRELYEQIVDSQIPIRRINVSFHKVHREECCQYDLFTDPAELDRERRMQRAILNIKGKFGKNAILRGISLEDHGTTIERNRQIGGHKSGI